MGLTELWFSSVLWAMQHVCTKNGKEGPIIWGGQTAHASVSSPNTHTHTNQNAKTRGGGGGA